MKNDKFDRLLSTIRNEHVDDKIVAQSGDRVWAQIGGDSPSRELSSHRLQTCDDFQELIPSYISKQLAPARAMLFEDHVHACVACRHALKRAREGETQVTWQLEKKSHSYHGWRWAFGVAAVAAITFVAIGFSNGTLPGQHPVRGQVQSVSGSLYAVTGDDVHLIPAGYQIGNGDRVRTAKGSTAVLRLQDGSLVEMGERAGISVSRAWKGTTIHLDDGQVIVQAAKQHTGHLFVATDDALVSVKGTIFSVNRGLKGSRVAVIEGVVRVDSGDSTTELHAGDETTSTPSVSKVPIQNEIAWSEDSAKYLAILGDFAILQKQFTALPGPGLRYSSDLLPYVPENTVVYAAIPNLSNTLGEASRLFEDRLRQSPALRDWWRQQQKGSGPKLEDVFNQLKTFSGYLGDEIVFTVGKTGQLYRSGHSRQGPQAGTGRFRAVGELSSAEGKNSVPTVRRSDCRSSTILRRSCRRPGEPLLVYLDNDLLIASTAAADLQQAVPPGETRRQRQVCGDSLLPTDLAGLPARGGMAFLRRHGTNCRAERT